ncbi:8394_t:CDS:2, partial [Funneliformis geosporum]
ESLPCIGLFGDLYTTYATSTLSGYGSDERLKVVGKRIFLKITNNNDTSMWASLTQMGMNDAFNGEKIFTKLASLMLQIKIKEEVGISMKGLRYSEHLTHFFSLLSESSHEYEVFHKALGGIQIRASSTEIITDPNLVLENVTKFAYIAKELKWEGLILLITDCTKIHSKLVYSQEIDYITGSTLFSNEISVSKS